MKDEFNTVIGNREAGRSKSGQDKTKEPAPSPHQELEL